MATKSSKMMNGFSESNDSEIVITGLSGRFPESNNVEEFKQQLLNGVDMVTNDSRRWPTGLYGLPERFGKLKNLSHFDAQYFGVHAKQAEQMDPQLRILLETTQEAIMDAGYNPSELRGTKCGVFIGSCASETLEYWERNVDEINGYALTGCSRAMFANRISYAFDFKGPSFTVDTACSSSLYALSQAVRAIKSGECDSAIVGGCNLLLKPNACIHFQRLGMLSPDGSCKSFDCTGNGYVRAEAIAVVFLQKSNVSRRIYSSIVGIQTNSDGYKDLGITFPSGEMQLKLIREVYNDAGIKSEDVCYIESHGTGTKVGDPQEMYAVSEFFCQNRKEPILVGSVKSNMGHAEGASAICSIAKVLVAMEEGIIPSNLHYSQPNSEILPLLDGRIKVVAENYPWNGGLVGVNSFGFGGANAHVILRSNPKNKLKSLPSKLPRVIGVSGRTEEAVKALLDISDKNKSDAEFLSLMDQIHKFPITGHNFRGYAVLDDSKKSEIKLSSEKRPIWFVYPGMGSQWPAMGRDLMKIDSFRMTIRKLAKILKPHGIDLEDLITNGNEESFENIVNAYVAITAIQIALTDFLKLLKIEPEGIVGHSFGEIGCAYADGCLTAEQAILCNLERGLSIINSNSPPGMMASAGLTWKEAKERCPPLVYPACHNAKNNVTVSGDPKEMQKFMETLTSEDIFVKEVKTAGYAFHCRFISKAAPLLQESLENVIPKAKPRSSKWISTSVQESSWDKPKWKMCSPEYFVNNLLSPVLFQEAMKHIPKNALLIEIAPSGLFQSLLKKSIGAECATVSLSKRGDNDNVNFLLSAVGKIYLAGAQPCFSALYDSPSFPVGRGTPMISPHIKWDHSTEWAVASFLDEEKKSGETLVEFDLSKAENEYLFDHKLDGRIFFPGAGYLTMVWQTFAKLLNQDYEKLPVIFENVNLLKPTILSKDEIVKFYINIFKGTGAFEIRKDGSLIVSGRIRNPEDVEKETIDQSKLEVTINKRDLPLSGEDIYQDLLLRGYEYSHLFRGIEKSDNEGNRGEISWSDNWTCFIDTVLQFTLINKDSRDLMLPTRFPRVTIDPTAQTKLLKSAIDGRLPVVYNRDLNVVKSGGIEVRLMKASIVPKRFQNSNLKLEKYLFIPYNADCEIELDQTQILTVLSQIVLENLSKSRKLRMSEVILKDPLEDFLTPKLKKIFESEPLVHPDASIISPFPMDATIFEENGIKIAQNLEDNLDLVICHDITSRNDLENLTIILNSVTKHGFVLFEESKPNSVDLKKIGLQMISRHDISGKSYLLYRKIVQGYKDIILIEVSHVEFSWVETLKKALNESEENGSKIYLYSLDRINGIIGLVNTLRKETEGRNIRYIFIQDQLSKPFYIEDYSEQLEKDLVHNVLKDGVWGCYKHLLLEDVKEKAAWHAVINTLTKGDLTSLKWIESFPLDINSISPGTEICHIYYSSLNFRDVMLATGKLPPDALPGDLAGQDNILGLEFSGRNSKGDRLMGMVESRSLATTVLVNSQFYWKVPKKWSLEEAATIPVAYSTAYYSLIMRAHLQPGESVLIHAGSGGVGIASISLALSMGCTVFTTVGSQSKREFLKSFFPKLQDKNIGYSRDTSFEQLVLAETKGKGVDVVLNSLAGEQLYASVRCLALNGRFLEIGKMDLSNDTQLGMNVFLKNIAFHGILVDCLFLPEMLKNRLRLVELINEGIENGTVKPLPITVFNEEQVEEAFRYMATGKHIGKVIIKIRQEEPQSLVIPKLKQVSAIPRAYMHPLKSYILVGGLGGFGLELADWLIKRGARRLVFSSRSGIKTGYQSFCIRKWRERGVRMVISTDDVTTELGARRLIEYARNLGPVAGIFNLAAILKDGIIQNQTEDTFRSCCSPKVDATINLDKISRELCEDLDYFVVFSSLASGRGNQGQSNYAFANSVIERICEDRWKCGYPGLAIQWGAVGDVGMAMKLLGSNDAEIDGTLPQRMSSCLKTMDILLEQRNPIVSSFVLAERKDSGGADNKDKLVESVANILGLKDKSSFPKNITLTDLGMDSLMLAEIKHILERNFDIVLNTSEIKSLTFDKLKEYESNVISLDKKAKVEKKHLAMKGIEVMPKETMVKMTKENDKTTLFMIHPIEGHIEALIGMASQIKAPVYGLQCTAEAPVDNIENLATFYLNHIRKVQKNGPYNIVGYSFGASIAFEIGLQLENDKQEVKLWLIDGSPDFVYSHLLRERTNASITANSDQEQNEALIFFMKQVSDVDEKQIAVKLKSMRSWEEKLSASMKVLSAITSIPEDELALAATSFFYKIQATDKYKPARKFKGEVHLMKAQESDVELDNDYGLSEICESHVEVVTLEGSHTSILIGASAERLAEILQPLR